jgi:hypothetical protein
MIIIPGIKYLETRASLIQKIRENNISFLEKEAIKGKEYRCVVCEKKIEGRTYRLPYSEVIDGKVNNFDFGMHPSCYEEVKKPQQFKPFSINEYFSRNKNNTN